MSRDALVVGINTYRYEGLNLKAPSQDAEAVAQLLEEYGNFKVTRLPAVKDRENGTIKVGKKTLVTLTQFEDAIAQLFTPEGKPPDTALLYFSGHGLRKSKGRVQEGFLASSDVDPDLGFYGLSLQWLRRILKESEVKEQIVILDCCYSGELLNFKEADPEDTSEKKARCFLTASRSFEVSYEEIDNRHSVFTTTLLKGLKPELANTWVNNYTLSNLLKREDNSFPQRPEFWNSGKPINLTSSSRKELIKISTVAKQGICPYKGLRYFDFIEEDAKYFYGRTALTDELLEKVRLGNFLAVLGASGSGKSSVIRAGLLYQLELGERLSGSENWLTKIFEPGEHPLQSLAEAFLDKKTSGIERASKLAKAEELIAKGADGLRQLVTSFVTDTTQRLVLVVDQFEEAFALCKDNEERQQFFDCLLGALQQCNDKLCLVLTMRSDFFGKCTEQDYSGLAQQIQQNLVTVTPMTREELKKAIVEPANFVELEIEQELVEEMLADVANAPATLPLLQDTLTELWKNRTDNCLRLNTYSQLGGVMGTLHQRATKVYESFDKEEQAVCKYIFLVLTQLGEGTEDTRRRCFKQDLVNKRYSEELVDEVVQKLADEKLIVTDEKIAKGGTSERVAVIDVAHEALIRHWTLLRRWVDENRDKLRQKRKIEAAAEEWRDKGNSKDYLLTGKQLRDAKTFHKEEAENLTLSNLSCEFIKKSIRHRRNNRFRLFGCVFSPVLLLSPFLAIFLGFISYREVRISHLRDVVKQGKGQKVNNKRFHALQQLVKLNASLKGINLSNANLWSADLSDANLSDANLSDANLSDANLSDANLSSADLSSADLSDANLRSADLSSANLVRIRLSRANLWEVNFSKANFSRASLIYADLTDANLSNANLSNANLYGANLKSVDLSGANLSSADLRKVNLTHANLTNVKLSSTKLNQSLYNKKTKFPENFNPKNQKMYLIAPGLNLRSVDLSGASFRSADLRSADLSSADFVGANFTYTNLRSANLRSANLIRANLYGAGLSRANLSRANFSRANFSRANLSGADLSGAIFWNKKNGWEAKNISPEQIKQAKNWEKAIYSPEFRKKLGLPPEQ
ncbi:MAG: pentapeptide repeat-containing protein [Cyanobacteria bacterium J06641_2]